MMSQHASCPSRVQLRQPILASAHSRAGQRGTLWAGYAKTTARLALALGCALCLLAVTACSDDDSTPGNGDGGGNSTLDSGNNPGTDSGTSKKAGGEDCTDDAECESGVCHKQLDDFGKLVSQRCKAVPKMDSGTPSPDTGSSPAPLTAMEQQVKGKWTYFYNLSSGTERHYIIWKNGRTGCQWYEKAGSTKRHGERKYVHWELKLVNSTSQEYSLKASNINGGITSFKYDADADKLWGTHDKTCVRTTTSKDCN